MKSSLSIYTLLLLVYLNSLVDCYTRFRRSATGAKWPNKRIPYSISGNYAKSDQEYIEKIIKLFESSIAVDGQKCLDFFPRTKEKSYMYFYPSSKCASNVGYMEGVNDISLSANGCIRKSIILHEIMHSIGFDHEQSRNDRNDHVNVFLDDLDKNIQSNFDINPLSNSKTNQYSPYDYYSILQYKSHTFQTNKNKLTITSKVHSLLKSDIIDFEVEELSPIDKIEIQRFYNCKEIPIQNIRVFDKNDMDYVSMAYDQFMNEAIKLKLSSDLSTEYFKRSIKTCGYNHYWPLDYPIVPNHHDLYKTVCLKKKAKNEACKFSIECAEDMECAKVFLRNGVCRKPNTSSIKVFARIIGSKISQLKNTIQKKWENELIDIKRMLS